MFKAAGLEGDLVSLSIFEQFSNSYCSLTTPTIHYFVRFYAGECLHVREKTVLDFENTNTYSL